MAKKKKLGKQMVTIKAGNVRIHVRGRTKRIAKANATRFMHTRMKRNVAEGFWQGGQFHPIRSSKDYSRPRAGEGLSKSQVRAAKAQITRLRKRH